MSSETIATIPVRMNDGQEWYAWIDYNGNTLEVRLSDTDSRPIGPNLSYDIDFSSVLLDTDAFVGFTSGTWAAGGDHDILSFELSQTISVGVDIKPSSCPNPFNTKSKGVLPVAVLGTEDFDVTSIDPSTIQLGREEGGMGVPPLRWNYEDVATPYEDEEETCGCHDLNGDGYLDLTLKFDSQQVKNTLGIENATGSTIPLYVKGNLNADAGGGEFEGTDCIKVLRTGKK